MVNKMVEYVNSVMGDSFVEYQRDRGAVAAAFGVDIRSVQDLLGHVDVRTTEIYTKLARAMRGEITSPLDDLDV